MSVYLKDCLSEQANIEVWTFHAWAGKNGVMWSAVTPNDQRDREVGERLFGVLKNGPSDAGKFDAVIIDEGQDFLRSWFQAAKLALKDPEGGDLLIAGDGAQSFRPRDIRACREAGIHARGRVLRKKFHLDRNYRNTIEVVTSAKPFADRPCATAPGGGEPVFEVSAVDPEMAVRSGPWPELVRLGSREQEYKYVANLIENWLMAGVDRGGERQPVSPSDIAVIYPYNHKSFKNRLIRDLTNVTEVVDLMERPLPDDVLRREGVRLCTTGAVKGLQFKIVAFIWADLLPSNFKDATEDGDRAQFYVALTRAKDVLLVTHSGDSPFIDHLQKALTHGR